MRLVHKEPVNAEFFNVSGCPFFHRQKHFQFGFQFLLGGFELLHRAPLSLSPFISRNAFSNSSSWLWKSRVGIFRITEFFQIQNGDDDGVPISRCDAAHQFAALVLFKILLGRRQNVRAG